MNTKALTTVSAQPLSGRLTCGLARLSRHQRINLAALAACALICPGLADAESSATASKKRVVEIGPVTQGSAVARSGEFMVKPDANDCRMFTYSLRTSYAAGEKRAVKGSTGAVSPFQPGISIGFAGHVCLPASDAFPALIKHIQLGGQTASGADGTFSSANRVITSARGEVAVTVPPDMEVFDIRSSGSQPLIFKVTPDGYDYVKGSGTVRTPKGNLYSFP